MTLQDYISLTRRHIVVLIVCTALGMGLAAISVLVRTPVYQATATAYVAADNGSTVGEAYSGNLLAQAKAKAYVPIVSSRQVASRVIENLGLTERPDALAGRVTAKVIPDSNLIEVTATGGSPAAASALANATVTAAADEVKAVETAASGERASDAALPVVLVPVENAGVPTTPISPRPAREIALGAVLGLLGGYGVALLRKFQDTRVRSREDVEAATGSSVMGVIPQSPALADVRGSLASGIRDFNTSEALRQLRTNLRYVDVDHNPRSIVVTSSRQGEGKSTIAATLAKLLADSGEQVVLVDADLRRPAVAGLFGVDGTVGITQVLSGVVGLEDALQPSGTAGLYVLPAGECPPNPSELLGSNRMHGLIERLSERHLVLLDAPPLLPVTDAALLAAHSDGALLVVAANQARVEHLQGSIRNLESVKARLLGTVLNGVNTDRVKRLVYGETTYGFEGYGDQEYVPQRARTRGRGQARR